MHNIQIQVADREAVALDDPQIICGNSDYTVTFIFDDEWDDEESKTARFSFYHKGMREYVDVLFTGDEAQVPTLYDVSSVEVGVYCGDLQTTTPARIACKRSILCGNATDATTNTANMYRIVIFDTAEEMANAAKVDGVIYFAPYDEVI